MTLLGNFSDDAFEEYQRLISEEQEIDFSEGDVYDFTRCVRADGSAYGTGGKCRQGSESAKEPKPSGKTRPKAAIESDMRKLTSSGAMQQRGLAGVKARAEHASLKAELNKSAQTKEEAPKDPVAGLRKQERSRQAKQAAEQKAKNLADAENEMKSIAAEIKNRGPHTKKELAELNEKYKYAANRARQIESGKTMTREQFQAGLRKMSAKD